MNNLLPRDDIHCPLRHVPSPYNVFQLLLLKVFFFANPCNHCTGNNIFHRPSPLMPLWTEQASLHFRSWWQEIVLPTPYQTVSCQIHHKPLFLMCHQFYLCTHYHHIMTNISCTSPRITSYDMRIPWLTQPHQWSELKEGNLSPWNLWAVSF